MLSGKEGWTMRIRFFHPAGLAAGWRGELPWDGHRLDKQLHAGFAGSGSAAFVPSRDGLAASGLQQRGSPSSRGQEPVKLFRRLSDSAAAANERFRRRIGAGLFTSFQDRFFRSQQAAARSLESERPLQPFIQRFLQRLGRKESGQRRFRHGIHSSTSLWQHSQVPSCPAKWMIRSSRFNASHCLMTIPSMN